MKGIILAGGSGTRLYPLTRAMSKQLLPIYDKPMIYYPLSVLMLAGIQDILIISTPEDTPRFQQLLGDGSTYGINLSYKIQQKPNGLAEAFIVGEEFINNERVCLILGDNIFYGNDLSLLLHRVKNKQSGATIFGYRVPDPERFGVVEFNEELRVQSIIEKPQHPKSNYAITGLYFFDKRVVQMAKHVTPSARGELEITDILNDYLAQNDLSVELLDQGYAWLDTGTHETLLQASQFIEMTEKNKQIKIGCIEEIAYRKGYISREQVIKLAKRHDKTKYGQYLLHVVTEKNEDKSLKSALV